MGSAMNILRSSKLLLVAAPLLFSAQLYSATPESVAVNVTFVTAITIVEVNSLSFGLVDTTIANGQTLILDTADGLTGTGSASQIGGTLGSGEVTIDGTAGVAATLLIDNIAAPGTGDYTMASFTCDYNTGGFSGACDGGGLAITTTVASAPVLIGATLTMATGTPTTGVNDTTFEINMTYN